MLVFSQLLTTIADEDSVSTIIRNKNRNLTHQFKQNNVIKNMFISYLSIFWSMMSLLLTSTTLDYNFKENSF